MQSGAAVFPGDDDEQQEKWLARLAAGDGSRFKVGVTRSLSPDYNCIDNRTLERGKWEYLRGTQKNGGRCDAEKLRYSKIYLHFTSLPHYHQILPNSAVNGDVKVW